MTNNDSLLQAILEQVNQSVKDKRQAAGIQHLVSAFQILKGKIARQNILEAMAITVDSITNTSQKDIIMKELQQVQV